MSQIQTISAQLRDRVGKGSARAARRDGRVPAVIYGGKRQPAAITIEARELIKHLNLGGFSSSLIELQADGKTQRVLPRDVQLHPVTDRPMHVDFLRVEDDTKVAIMVHVVWTGEEECPGLKRGGVLNVVRHEIELLCPAGAIPETVECSIEALDIGDGLHINDIDLPSGVVPKVTDRDFTILTIASPSGLTAEEEEEEAEDEEGEFEELEADAEAADSDSE